MNRQYIDFVPVKSEPRPEPAVILPKKTPPVIMPKPVAASKPAVSRPTMSKPAAAPKPTAKKIKSEKIAMKPSAVMGKGFVQEALKKKVIQRKKETPAKTPEEPKKAVDEDKILQEALDKADNLAQPLKVPQARFVNTEKIVKRPLSKNVYQKKIVEPKEVEQAPITIIAKPEKDSKVGIVVTVIITIILGAAAGTVAFLLLPK